MVATFPTRSPAFAALVVASCNKLVCVNSPVIACSANNAPVTLDIVPDISPSLPPDIEAIPESDDIAKDAPINDLSSFCILCVAVSVALAFSITLCVVFGFIDTLSATLFKLTPEALGTLGALPGLFLPLCVAPTAAVDKLDPALATSSCLLCIPTSRPFAISWPILIVFFDGDAVPAATAADLIALLEICSALLFITFDALATAPDARGSDSREDMSTIFGLNTCPICKSSADWPVILSYILLTPGRIAV